MFRYHGGWWWWFPRGDASGDGGSFSYCDGGWPIGQKLEIQSVHFNRSVA